nr:hypothetical protein [uncultured Cohaesibacter sp.]
MTRRTTFIAFMTAIVGALIFSLPTQACKISGGRKLAEATGIIVERSNTAANKSMNQQPLLQAQITFFKKNEKSLNQSHPISVLQM